MKAYCEHCRESRETEVIQIAEEISVKGFPINIDATVRVCSDCKSRIGDNSLDDANLDKAFREYRNAKGLLMPEQIKAIRESYRLSQVAFAKILGLGDKTIARYENGSLQEEAQNNLILLMQDPNNFRILLEKNKDELSADDRRGMCIPLWGQANMTYRPAVGRKYVCGTNNMLNYEYPKSA